jgi:hypothetical protein
MNQTDEHLNVFIYYLLNLDFYLFYFSFKNFANDSLRTLCLAWRELDRSEYDQWVEKLNNVK